MGGFIPFFPLATDASVGTTAAEPSAVAVSANVEGLALLGVFGSSNIGSLLKRFGDVLFDTGVSGSMVLLRIGFLMVSGAPGVFLRGEIERDDAGDCNSPFTIPPLGVAGGSNKVFNRSMAHVTNVRIVSVYLPSSLKYLISKDFGGLSRILIKFLKNDLLNKFWKAVTRRISSPSSNSLKKFKREMRFTGTFKVKIATSTEMRAICDSV